jgi:hypothetical protein
MRFIPHIPIVELGVMYLAASLPGVYGDTALILSLLGGAFCGAALGLWLHPPVDKKDAVVRGVGAVISATVFTPLLLRWKGWPLEVDIVVAASTGVAMLSWFGVVVARQVDPIAIGRSILELLLSKISNKKPPEE